MAVISITRLHLQSMRYLLPFVWHSLRSTRQVQRAPGFLGGQLAGEGLKGFWTITAWRDEVAMRAYRNADAHRRAMPKLLQWWDEASVVHWQQERPDLPNMDMALQRMVADGRISKVRHPSPTQAMKQIAPQQAPRAGRQLRPSNAKRSCKICGATN